MDPIYLGYAVETLTVSSTSKSLTETVYTAGKSREYAERAFITVEDADIRYWANGTDPVAGTSGHLLAAGDSLVLTKSHSIRNFRAIRDGATDAVLQVSYESNH
jgi:hypothetical protein